MSSRRATPTSAALPLCLALLGACASGEEEPEFDLDATIAALNPAAQGFDLMGSDAAAIEVANDVMDRLGGRAAWNETRFVAWRFFDRRDHLWDRRSGDLRVVDGSRTVLMNVITGEGRAWDGGEEVTDAAELKKLLDGGYAAWINDSYWLLMPYKLKDTGVTLRHGGLGRLSDGRPADVLTLTFSEVGYTPRNKYDVWVARDTRLVEQWAFYSDADDLEPRFVCPWEDWRPYGSVWLSGDRGDIGQITEIRVFDVLPRTLLTDPAPIDLTLYEPAGRGPGRGP